MTQVSQCAGGIVIFQDQVLVIHQNANSWSLPKGHCDPGEDVEFTARREIAEESGVSALDLITPLGTYARHKLALGGGDDLRELKEITMFLYRALSPRLGSIEPQSRPVWVHHSVVADLLSHPKDRAFYKSQMDTVVAHLARRMASDDDHPKRKGCPDPGRAIGPRPIGTLRPNCRPR